MSRACSGAKFTWIVCIAEIGLELLPSRLSYASSTQTSYSVTTCGAMTPSTPAPIPLSAPGLIGPNSILNPPWSGPRSNRRGRDRSFSHVHLDIDLRAEFPERTSLPSWKRLESIFQEHKRAKVSDLAWLSAHTLHALSVCRFRRIDHWELSPGGWLPPPEFSSRDPNGAEPVGQLLNALEGETTSSFAAARSFSIRTSDLHGNRIDVTIRKGAAVSAPRSLH